MEIKYEMAGQKLMTQCPHKMIEPQIVNSSIIKTGGFFCGICKYNGGIDTSTKTVVCNHPEKG